MTTVSAPGLFLSVSDSHCSRVTTVLNSSPQFYTWDASSPIGCIFKKVLSQFLKLWALFFPSARILLMPSYFMLPFLTKPAFQSTSCTHVHEMGGTATGSEPGRAETWAHITAGRATEVCSPGITLFLQCWRISKPNSMHFRAGSKVPMKKISQTCFTRSLASTEEDSNKGKERNGERWIPGDWED